MALTKINFTGQGVLPHSKMPSDSVLQTKFHSWNTQTIVTSTSYTDITDSSFTFTSKLASSLLLISYSISYFTSSTGHYSGGSVDINVDGSNIMQSAQQYEFYATFTGATSNSFYSRASKDVSINASNTNAKTIKLQAQVYDTNASMAIRVNESGNYRSSIKVVEIAA